MPAGRSSAAFVWRFFSGHRARTARIALYDVAYSVLEGLGLAAFLPVLEELTDAADRSVVSDVLASALSVIGLELSLGTAILATLFFFVLKTFLQYRAMFLGARNTELHRAGLITRLFRAYGEARWEHFIGVPHGALLNVVAQETAIVQQFFDRLTKQLSNVIHVVVLLAISFLISPPLTLLALAFVATVAALVSVSLRRLRRLGTQVVSSGQLMVVKLSEYLRGFRTLKAYVVFGPAAKRVDDHARDRATAHIGAARVESAVQVGMELLLVATVLGLLYVSVTAFSRPIAEVGVVGVMLLRIAQRAKEFRGVATLGSLLPSLELVDSTLEEFTQARGDSLERPSAEEVGPLLEHELRFDDVSFRYERVRDRPALSRVTFSVPAGSMVGIAGTSGSGKSTLVSLLLGFVLPSEGQIRVDGTPLHELDLSHWRSRIGYVPQEPFLLNDTVRANIDFYRDLPDARIEDAAEQALLGPLLERLPDGLDTVIGELGADLSGGEGQRICLARALAGDPDILVLDEATSALDSESERTIRSALLRLRGELTMIAVAHRLSTIEDADLIVVMAGGEVVEVGPPTQLLRQAGAFRRLHDLQVGAPYGPPSP